MIKKEITVSITEFLDQALQLDKDYMENELKAESISITTSHDRSFMTCIGADRRFTSIGFSRSKKVDVSFCAIILASVVLPHCLGPSNAETGCILNESLIFCIGSGLAIMIFIIFLENLHFKIFFSRNIGRKSEEFQEKAKRSDPFSGDDTINHEWSDATSTRFLRNAVELFNDNIGKNNGLYESDDRSVKNRVSYSLHVTCKIPVLPWSG